MKKIPIIICIFMLAAGGCAKMRKAGGNSHDQRLAQLEAKARQITSYAADYTVSGMRIKRMYYQFEKDGKPFFRFREDLVRAGKRFVYIYNADGRHDYHYYPDERKAYRCPTNNAWNKTNYEKAQDRHFGYSDAVIIGEDVFEGKACWLLEQHHNVYAVWKEKGIRLAKMNSRKDEKPAIVYENIEFDLSDDVFRIPPDVAVTDRKDCVF